MYDALHVFAREGHRTSGYSFVKLWRTKFMLLLRRGYLFIKPGFEPGLEPGLELGLERGLDSGFELEMTSSDFDE